MEVKRYGLFTAVYFVTRAVVPWPIAAVRLHRVLQSPYFGGDSPTLPALFG